MLSEEWNGVCLWAREPQTRAMVPPSGTKRKVSSVQPGELKEQERRYSLRILPREGARGWSGSVLSKAEVTPKLATPMITTPHEGNQYIFKVSAAPNGKTAIKNTRNMLRKSVTHKRYK